MLILLLFAYVVQSSPNCNLIVKINPQDLPGDVVLEIYVLECNSSLCTYRLAYNTTDSDPFYLHLSGPTVVKIVEKYRGRVLAEEEEKLYCPIFGNDDIQEINVEVPTLAYTMCKIVAEHGTPGVVAYIATWIFAIAFLVSSILYMEKKQEKDNGGVGGEV